MGTYLPGLNFPIYSGWTQYTPVIPKLYWDVYSAEQRMKQLCVNFDKVEHYLDYIAGLMNEWNLEFSEEIEQQFQDMWDEVHAGYEEHLDDWFRSDGERIFKELYSSVYFGLNLDGYFVAYVPESWDDIIFDTGMDYSLDTYGRLILRMDVDSPYDHVDQTPEYVHPDAIIEEIHEYVNNILETISGLNTPGTGD